MLNLAAESPISLRTKNPGLKTYESNSFSLLFNIAQVNAARLEPKTTHVFSRIYKKEFKILVSGDDNLCTELIHKLKSCYGQTDILNVETAKIPNDMLNADIFLVACNELNPTSFVELNKLDHFRIKNRPPLFILTESLCEKTQIQALQQGYDHIYRFNLSIEELLLRITNAVIDKHRGVSNETDQNVLTMGELVLQKKDRIVCFQDRCTSLTRVQFRLLWVLCQYRGNVISRKNLYEKALEKSLADFDRSLDMQICRIRKKLDELGFPTDQICCIRGKGYQLNLS